jgi:aerobic carbon-monoxide dehydrogenase small subunit
VRFALTVNGGPVEQEIAPQTLLLDFVRDGLGLTGAKRSCEVQVCGTCTLLVDGQPVSSCCYLAADAAGRDVVTIEGLREQPEFQRLERAFLEHAALQCGFCTPGMLLTVSALLADGELESEEAIKRNLAGNLCRCTGYRGIVEAVADLARGAGGAPVFRPRVAGFAGDACSPETRA